MTTPEIETERLILLPPQVEFAKEAFKNWTSDQRVTKFMIYTKHKDVSETIEWLKECVSNIYSDNVYEWCVKYKDNGNLIGSGGLIYNLEKDRWVLGYNFAYDYWHKGIGTEFVQAVMNFVINTAGIKRFYCQHAEENIYSGKVMENVGFIYVGNAEYTCTDGRKYGTKYYYLDIKD